MCATGLSHTLTTPRGAASDDSSALQPARSLGRTRDMIQLQFSSSVRSVCVVCACVSCVSWWVLSALAILGKSHWIDAHALGKFVIDCQDPSGGGISDRPGNIADVFHTYFGIAGLALLGYPDLEPIDPVYALPARICEQMKLPNRFVPHNDSTTAPNDSSAAPAAASK